MSAPKMSAGVALTLHGAATPGEPKLSWEETRRLAAFEKLDPKRRLRNRGAMEAITAAFPKHAPVKLLLVVGGVR